MFLDAVIAYDPVQAVIEILAAARTGLMPAFETLIGFSLAATRLGWLVGVSWNPQQQTAYRERNAATQGFQFFSFWSSRFLVYGISLSALMRR